MIVVVIRGESEGWVDSLGSLKVERGVRSRGWESSRGLNPRIDPVEQGSKLRVLLWDTILRRDPRLLPTENRRYRPSSTAYPLPPLKPGHRRGEGSRLVVGGRLFRGTGESPVCHHEVCTR